MTPAERESAILGLATVVEIMARRRVSTLPRHVKLDDLRSAAWIGAIDAVDKYKPERKVPLAEYARWRIAGEILDYLRSVDHLSRDERMRVQRGEIEAPIVYSIDAPIVIHNAKMDDVVSAQESISDVRAERDQAQQHARLTLTAIFARAKLSPRKERMLRSYFFKEKTMKQIAKRNGVNESRVSQLCKESIEKLRAAA